MHLNTAYFIVGVAARRQGIVVAKDRLALIPP